MKCELLFTTELIEEAALLKERTANAEIGAVVSFSGIVRATEEGRPITGLDYEAYQTMAEHQFQIIFKEMQRRWPIHSIRVIHRLGVVQVGETSFWAEVMAGHRAEAFAACQFLIDEMKRVVPIWKKVITT